jgi:hypothetical protein
MTCSYIKRIQGFHEKLLDLIIAFGKGETKKSTSQNQYLSGLGGAQAEAGGS